MNGLYIQFATGSNPFPPPWINTDYPEVDVTKPLPYPDNSCKFLYASHLVEHLELRELWNFLKECRRILQYAGTLRLVFPDAERISRCADEEYLQWLEKSGLGPATLENAVANILLGHGHKIALTQEMMCAILNSLALRAYPSVNGHSGYPELQGLDLHWRAIGKHADKVESVAVEARK